MDGNVHRSNGDIFTSCAWLSDHKQYWGLWGGEGNHFRTLNEITVVSNNDNGHMIISTVSHIASYDISAFEIILTPWKWSKIFKKYKGNCAGAFAQQSTSNFHKNLYSKIHLLHIGYNCSNHRGLNIHWILWRKHTSSGLAVLAGPGSQCSVDEWAVGLAPDWHGYEYLCYV